MCCCEWVKAYGVFKPLDEGHAFVTFSQDSGRTFGAPVQVDEAGTLGRVDVEQMADGSAIVGWIDRYLVDGVLNVVSAWTLDGSDGLRRIQTGKVQDYVFAVGFGLLALIAWIGVGW